MPEAFNPAPRRRQIPKSVKLSPRNCLQKKERTFPFLVDLVQKKLISSSHNNFWISTFTINYW